MHCWIITTRVQAFTDHTALGISDCRQRLRAFNGLGQSLKLSALITPFPVSTIKTMSTPESYTEAIMFMLDSITRAEKSNIEEDIRIKMRMKHELRPATLQGIETLSELIKVHDCMREIN